MDSPYAIVVILSAAGITGAIVLGVIWVLVGNKPAVKAFSDAVEERERSPSKGHAIAQLISGLIMLALVFLLYEAIVTEPWSTLLNNHPSLIWICSLVLLVYFLPSIVAIKAKRANALAIMAVNILLGWTLLGWIGSLIWALISERSQIAPIIVAASPATGSAPGIGHSGDLVDRLSKAAQMKAEGHITDEEFANLKKSILSAN